MDENKLDASQLLQFGDDYQTYLKSGRMASASTFPQVRVWGFVIWFILRLSLELVIEVDVWENYHAEARNSVI